MARAFGRSVFRGSDYHRESIDTARGRRWNVHRRLLRLESDEALLRRDVVTGLHEDLDDLYVREITKIGYYDFHNVVLGGRSQTLTGLGLSGSMPSCVSASAKVF